MVAGIDEVELLEGVATKRHGGADGVTRSATSALALAAAAEAGLPVPVLLGVEGRVLRTAVVTTGVLGVQLLTVRPVDVLTAIGAFAARLHATPPPAGLPVGDPDGVWVHGDLCPVNVVVDEGLVTAALDWEDARVDDPLVDLVWTEWLVRTHHPAAVGHLGALYDAHGTRPPPAARRRAAMRAVLERRRAVEQDAAGWRRHLAALPTLDLDAAPGPGRRPAGDPAG